MDIRVFKKSSSNIVSSTAPNTLRTVQRAGDTSTRSLHQLQTAVKENAVQPADETDDMFTHAPVSLWEEDFSEVKRRFDQLRRGGIEDLGKHLKQHPEEVLALARMIRIVRVNNETLTLYDASGPVEFREGLSPIFNKSSFEVFKEELMAFWTGRTSFFSEAINLTLSGTSKNIIIQMIIPPGFEKTWAKVYVAITDITAIRDSMKSLAASEQKYRAVLDAVQTAVLLADGPSGMIIEANRSAKRLFGSKNDGLVGLHLTDLVEGQDQDRIRAILRLQQDRPCLAGEVLHIRNKINGSIPAHVTNETIAIGETQVIVLTLIPAAELVPVRPSGRKARTPQSILVRKLTQREREILRLICGGKTSRTIAQQLSISAKTVETHRTRIMQKLDAHCVVDLVKFAMFNGLAPLQ